jgi:dihydroneopterin aldolase
MADRIKILGLTVDAYVGVYPHEEQIHQRLVFDIELFTDIRPAAASDDVHQTIDYDLAAAVTREVTGRRHYRLIETIAEEVSSELLRRFDQQLSGLRLMVSKPGAVPDARSVAVEVERARKADGS